jgi:hypothetical protein
MYIIPCVHITQYVDIFMCVCVCVCVCVCGGVNYNECKWNKKKNKFYRICIWQRMFTKNLYDDTHKLDFIMYNTYIFAFASAHTYYLHKNPLKAYVSNLLLSYSQSILHSLFFHLFRYLYFLHIFFLLQCWCQCLDMYVYATHIQYIVG